MKDAASLHLKVQEMCDCYATTDPLKEMSAIAREADKEAAALKWLALAALHGVNFNAEKITIKRTAEGTFSVTAQYRRAELPSPGRETGARIFETFRGITHIEDDKGKTRLALGIRDSSVDLQVKIKKDRNGGEKISLRFP